MDGEFAHLLLIFVLLVFSAMFSGSETAIFSLSPLHVEKIRTMRHKASRTLLKFIKKPREMLVTILSGNMIVNIAATAVMTAFIARAVPGKGAEYTIPIMTVLLLLFGEITPKVVAARWNIKFSLKVAPFLEVAYKVLYPMRVFLESVGARFGGDVKEEINEADIRAMIDVLRRSGELKGEVVHALITALELDTVPLSEVMIEKSKWVVVDDKALVGDVRRIFDEMGCEFVAIMVDDSLDSVVTPQELVGVDDKELAARYSVVPIVVGSDTRPSVLLAQFSQKRVRWALVVENGEEKGIIGEMHMVRRLFEKS